MQRIKRVWAVAVVGLSVVGLSIASAEPRGSSRDAKGSGLTLHKVSASQAEGFNKITAADGGSLFVSSKATWTSVDVASAVTEGGALQLTLSGQASKRMQTEKGKIAVYVGGELLGIGSVDANGRVVVNGLSAEQAERATTVVNAVTPVNMAGPVISVVPAGRSGDRYMVDVFVQGVPDIRSYQVTMMAGGGDSGTLQLEDVRIDSARPEYVFGSSQTVTANSPMTGKLAAVLYDGTAAALKPAYLGTMTFRASPDAAGTFRVNVEVGPDSIVATGDNKEVGYSVGADARIVVGPTRTGRDDK